MSSRVTGWMMGSLALNCQRSQLIPIPLARCSSSARGNGITANEDKLRTAVQNSIGVVTALNPYIGYANATAVAQEAHVTGGSVYEIVLRKGLLSQEELDRILRPESLTRPVPLDLHTKPR